MSWKSIILSILSVITLLGVIVGVVFLFKVHIVAGIAGLLAVAVPVILNRKAVAAANGTFDKVLAKYIAPAVALVGIVFIVLLFTLWL